MRRVDPRTYELVMEAYGYCCALCWTNKNIELHHRLPKYERYQDKYPLFIHSFFNLVPLCKYCHDNKKHMFDIQEVEAKKAEEYLRLFKTNSFQEEQDG